MKNIVTILLFLFSVTCYGISVNNPPVPNTITGLGTIDYVPQFLTTGTLGDGFPITTTGKNIVNYSSTANLLTGLGIPNHNLFTVTAGSLYGLGTTTPNYILDINGATTPTLRIKTASSTPAIIMERTNGSLGDIKIEDAGGTLTFATATNGSTWSTRMSILSSGFVGINTTVPQYQTSIVGNFGVTGNIYESNSSYAELYVSYNATVTAITSAGVYATVTANVIQDDLKNFTFTSTGSDVYLTAGVAGTYQFCLYMSFSGGNSDEFHGGISVNNNRPSGKHEFSRKMGAGGDVGSAGTGGIITLAVNDVLRIKITNETDADDPVVKNLNFSIRRIAP